VLWDVDYTLLAADGVGSLLYAVALRELYGLELPRRLPTFAGRTDSAIALEVLAAAGVPDPVAQLEPFHAFLTEHAADLTAYVRERGRVLPGVAEAIATLAQRQVVQSLLTGNLPELARMKLGALDLADHLDLSIGAYGDVSAIRADLVGVARSKAAARHGAKFAGRATVLVGDTPSDVEAALVTGATAVAVATGGFSAAELAAAGAHVVLPDLADTPSAVAAILGAPELQR
jgi:phosphoglycolate phosphatase